MPKQPEVSEIFLISELKKWPDIFNSDGSLKGYASPIWKAIQKSLRLNMLPKSLFFFIYKNERRRDELRSFFKVQKTQENKITTYDSDYAEYDISNPYNCDDLDFILEIPKDDVINCLDTKKKKKEWTENIRDQIKILKNLPCPFALNGHITKDKFKFYGQCNDCETGIFGEGNNNEDNLSIRVKTFATYAIPHSKKLKLKGSKRLKVKNAIRNQSACNYRESELGKITTSYEPPDLNSTVTLRKVKEEALDESIGYTEFKGKSITNKAFINHCSIRKLSVNPFYIMYFSDQQLEFWNEIQHKMLPLSFDATGGLFRKYKFYPSIKSKTTYYYVMVIGMEKKIIPILQAISSMHHVPVIQEVLDRWIESGAKIPKEISTDGSVALQNAICLSFNKMTFKEYNAQCFRVLLDEKNHELPNCYYRHDVAHLLKAIADWKCLKQMNQNVRDFYLRSVGYLTQINNLEKFKDVVKSIVIIADSQLAEEGSEPYVHILKLLKIFKTYEHELSEMTTPSTNSSTRAHTNLTSFINNLFHEISSSNIEETLSDKANFYYCPDFIQLFKNVCYTFPSWTNCMKDYFHSPNLIGTSTRSETYFKYQKDRIPNPIKLEKFILRDCKKLQSSVKVGFMKLKNNKQIKLDNDKKQETKCGNLFDLKLKDLISAVQQHKKLSSEGYQASAESIGKKE